MSAGPQLSMFSVLRISPSPPRTLGLLSALPTELCNYHDNYSQQRPDSADEGKEGTMYLPVKASSRRCCLLKGLCQNSPLPTPLVSLPPPPGLIHPPTVKAVPGLSGCADQDGKPPTFLDTAHAWCWMKTQVPVFNEIRQIYIEWKVNV